MAAVSCTIPGATSASWGCARVDGSRWEGQTIAIQDLKEDDYPIRVRVKQNGTWSFTNISHGSSSVGYYATPHDATSVRIHRGWNAGYIREKFNRTSETYEFPERW